MRYINLKSKEDLKIKKLLSKNGFSLRSINEILKSGFLINDKMYKENKDIKKDDDIKIIIEDENLDYKPIDKKLDILYEDRDILVLNKEPNITINSKNQVTLANHIAYYFKENNIKSKIRFINRLDMNTSGIIMIAKHRFAQSYYQKEIEENRFIKKYIAVVEGLLKIERSVKVRLSYDEINKNYIVSDDGNLALTYFKSDRYDKERDISYIICDIKTGKTHQIRASLSYMGYPIIGDKLYGSNINMDRFLLHAYYINFNKFITKENISVKSMPIF